MKVFESGLLLQIFALATFCDANNFGPKTFESVFLNGNPTKAFQATSKVSGNFESKGNQRLLIVTKFFCYLSML